MSASVTNEEEEGDAAMWDRLVSERRRGSHAWVGCALGRGELDRGGQQGRAGVVCLFLFFILFFFQNSFPKSFLNHFEF